jgi:hypothetical protein
MQTPEHTPRQCVVACAVHPNNAEVVLEIEAEELTVPEDLGGLLRNESMNSVSLVPPPNI